MGEAQIFECVICENDLPEGRKLTCCHDCYREWQFRRFEQTRKDVKGKHRMVCKACGNLFFTRHNPGQYQISIINKKFCSMACKEKAEEDDRIRARKFMRRLAEGKVL